MPFRQLTIALTGILVSSLIPICRVHAQSAVEPTTSIHAWMEELDSDSYYQRRAARQNLLESASHGSGSDRDQTVAALRSGLADPSMEVRLTAREILMLANQRRVDHDLARLVNPRVLSTDIQSLGWPCASKILGEDFAARKLYAAIYRRRPHVEVALSIPRDSERARRVLATIDPYRIATDDQVQWAYLLLLETVCADEANGNLNWRTWMSLSNVQLGLRSPGSSQSRVLRRLISHWLTANQDRCPQRESLLISMRYQCLDHVDRLCGQIYDDVSAPPATQVMALLCASATRHREFLDFAHARLDDQRIAHVWQLIAGQQSRIRTQVRDVALALLLHHQGIDPREIGYRDLQADPVLVFRDHSLGFADQERREQAHRQGFMRLGIGDL